MGIDHNKTTVREFWGAMNNGDLDAQLALCSEEVVFNVSGTTGASGLNEGKPAVRHHLQNFATLVQADAGMEVRELIAEGDIVVYLSEGTMQARTGMAYNNSYGFVFRFHDSLIFSVTEFLDTVLVETALFGKHVS